MKKRVFQQSVIALLLANLCLSTFVTAQDYTTTKEKIYVQTSHVFFKPGEVLYFKIYVVKAADQKPSKLSKVVYAELLSPSGTVVQKSIYPIQDGYAEGSFDFPEEFVGGIYKIRVYTSWMQNETENHFFVKEIILQKVLAPRIMMKLDFPEKGYGAGDEVKADFSMRNLANMPIRSYAGKFTVSVGGEAIRTQSFLTDKDGKAVIQFPLPRDLSVNDGLLNVTVEYDSYTEAISRSIPIVLNKIDLQFMPEGGTLVVDIPNWIAYKSLNEFGKAADIKGEVMDDRGNRVASFESYHFGMGKFLLSPKAGRSYKAIITSPSNIRGQYELPAATTKGVVMNIRKEKKVISIKLYASTGMGVSLIGRSKNLPYYVKDISLAKGENNLSLDESIFPAGIAQFTLYSDDELPLAERLVFMNEDQQLHVTITTDKQKYLPREKIKLTIKTIDENGKPVPSNLSLAVVDDKLWTFADDKQDHILSWLMLSSELKGKIEEPQFYFKKDESKAIPALDLLMLTQGYRYFEYIDYVVKQGSLKYLPDQDNILSGQVLNAAFQPIKAKLYIINIVPGGKAMQITTNDDGMFFFTDLQPHSNYYLFAQATNKKDKVNITISQNGFGYNPEKARALKQLVSKTGFEGTTSPLPPANFAARKMILGENKQQLGQVAYMQEAVVTGLGQTRLAKELGFAVTMVNNNLVAGIKIQNELAGKVAGLQINQNANFFEDAKVTLRGIRSLSGNNQPLYVVNGVPMDKLNLHDLNTNDIESVTVLKDGTATSLYGSRAANGVIILESKKFRREKIRFKFSNKYYYASQAVYTAGTAYSVAKKFYVPKYKTTLTEERTDFRETIYWNPVVQTDRNGTASVEFYNSDVSSTFRAIAEGIGFNGILGRTEFTYAVETALRVDAKIPPYLTVGDKALIPLVIKNNSSTEQTFTIDLVVPSDFKIGEYAGALSIIPGHSAQLLIPLEATAASSGHVQFTVSGASSKETVSLPIAATDKGFPMKITYAGNQSGQFDFRINKMIPGTLTAKLKLFKNLEGQLLDGIESMLREPYGCFEQTSSTTYPNIFVLKYLKESGKSNPEIEKKAMGYIERGYKKLVGFETAQEGFEWFGKTPPHEALTAYGLLEFTDMKEFIDVDKKMLERTKKFLLSRRDGKGSFNLINSGYDQFASVPNKIANIYIVYALTKAGIGNEISKEYETAVKQAISSKDGYQLAMTALSAHKMGDTRSYNQLMDELSKQNDKMNVETSVVNSRDASLRVETNALYAMAMMKATSPQLGRIADLISRILGEKNYYGYGSTQATVLALQAIVEYSKLTGRISEDAPVRFNINNKTITENNTIKEFIQEGSNIFSVNYPQKDKAIPYNLEISYSTFTPPNNEKAELQLITSLRTNQAKVGETVRMQIEVTNIKSTLQPMAIAKIGIPAGLAVQPWQLKEIMEKNKLAYYEVFDNYLVFYWMGFAPNETKTIDLDLKAEVPGTYKGKASTVYLYYTPEHKHWNEGKEIVIKE